MLGLSYNLLRGGTQPKIAKQGNPSSKRPKCLNLQLLQMFLQLRLRTKFLQQLIRLVRQQAMGPSGNSQQGSYRPTAPPRGRGGGRPRVASWGNWGWRGHSHSGRGSYRGGNHSHSGDQVRPVAPVQGDAQVPVTGSGGGQKAQSRQCKSCFSWSGPWAVVCTFCGGYWT